MAVIDAEFDNTLANGLCIPGVPKRQSIDPHHNPSLRATIRQTFKPAGVSGGFDDFDHVVTIVDMINNVNHGSQKPQCDCPGEQASMKTVYRLANTLEEFRVGLE